MALNLRPVDLHCCLAEIVHRAIVGAVIPSPCRLTPVAATLTK